MNKAEQPKENLNNFEIVDGQIITKDGVLKPREGDTPFRLHDRPHKKFKKSKTKIS